MEMLHFKPVGGEILPQIAGEGGGAAEPDAGALPVGLPAADLRGGKEALRAAGVQVQGNTRSGGLRLQGGGFGGVGFDGAVVEVDGARRVAAVFGGERFHAGDKRGDADAAADPDLAFASAEGEAAVGAFEGGGLAGGEGLRKAGRVVAEGFDFEGEAVVFRRPGTGDGVGVRGFAAVVRAQEEELSGLVAGPVWGGEVEGKDTRLWCVFNVLDCRFGFAAVAGAFEEDDKGRDGAADEEGGSEPADGLRPVAVFDEDDGMVGECEVGEGEVGVEFGEPVVGDAFEERHDHEDESDVERPFADVFSQSALQAKPLLEGFDGLPCALSAAGAAALRAFEPTPADHPFGALREPPVGDADEQGGNAQPFVQAVHFIETAEGVFDEHRARGEHHAEAHGADADDAAVLHEDLAEGEVAEGLRPKVVGGEPEGAGEDEEQPEGGFDGFHEGNPWFVFVMQYIFLCFQAGIKRVCGLFARVCGFLQEGWIWRNKGLGKGLQAV